MLRMALDGEERIESLLVQINQCLGIGAVGGVLRDKRAAYVSVELK